MDAAQLTVGQRVTVPIHDIAFGGEGVGRVQDFVVFVPFVLVGETVEVEILEVKKSFARAKLLNVVTSAPERVKPECQYFGTCGGCQYQHMEYGAQLRMKRKQIADLFERIGKFPSTVVDEVVPCPQPYGYRNRIMVRSQWSGADQRLLIGFLRHDNRWVVELKECKIAEPALNAQIENVHRNPPPKGGIKVTLRIMPENWELPRDSFFQNNFFLLPKLVETVRERFKESGNRFVVDTYCGVGFFGIELGDLAEKFVGVEIDLPAIRAARKNAASRNLTNGEFIVGDTSVHLPALLQRYDAAQTTLVLDPPRTGCPPESMKLLREVRPAQIIYISCHPATLARDLQILCEGGAYELQRLTPLDMFPQTQHVECVADLRRKTTA